MPVRAACRCGKALPLPAFLGWVEGAQADPRLPPGRVGPAGLPRRERLAKGATFVWE